MFLKCWASCQALYRNDLIQPSLQPLACQSSCFPILQMRTQRLSTAKHGQAGHRGLLNPSAPAGPLQEVFPHVHPPAPPLCPCALTVSTRSPCSMISGIFWPCWVLCWASCRSSWPSPTWQRPYLVVMFLHCVPLPQPGPPITKMTKGDLRMPAVPREEEGEGLVPVGASRHPSDYPQFSGYPWGALDTGLLAYPLWPWGGMGGLRLAWWYTQA